MTDSRLLVLKIIKEKDHARKMMLYGMYKSKLSKEQISFINKKLSINNQELIDYAVNKLGCKLI